MGNTKIRRLVSQENRWTDKKCKRHQHNFCIPCIVRLSGNTNRHIGVDYYSAVKCRYCNSFRYAHYIPREHDAMEKIQGQILLDFRKPHVAIGMRDIAFVKAWNPTVEQ